MQKTAPDWTPPWPHAEAHRLTPGVTHGLPSTYAHGCRCRTRDGLAEIGCTDAWTEYRRDKVRERRRVRKLEEARQLLREAGELA